MLRWGMEMILHTVKIGFFNMFVEQRNGLGAEPTLLLLLWETILVQKEVVAVTSFVEFHLFLLLNLKLFVIEFENVIRKVFVDLHVGL